MRGGGQLIESRRPANWCDEAGHFEALQIHLIQCSGVVREYELHGEDDVNDDDGDDGDDGDDIGGDIGGDDDDLILGN